jgi:phosphodiesterase/alkaline phosphatase D-like protein
MLAEPFGSGLLCSVNGLAVNDSTGVVYVADGCQSKVFAFVPRVVPDVKTGPATNVGHTAATLTGEAAPDPSGGGEVSECNFEIGTDTSYGTTVPCEPSTPYGGPTPVHADVTGLTVETTYHYRIAARNSIDTNYGPDRTFTPHRVLGLTTEPATNVGQTGVTLNGSFEPNGEDTHYFFEWGTDDSYGNVTPTEVEPSSTPGVAEVHADLSGLATYTKYHFRIVASNSLGTSVGMDEVVRTEAPSPPLVVETAATGVTDSVAHLSGSINPNDAATVYRFQYGTDASYGRQTPTSESIGEDGSPHAVSADISGLEPGTTYHFRVMATNFGGTALGPDMTFTTQAAPSVEGTSASGISTTGATLEARVNPALSPTTVRFEYGETPAYGSSTSETGTIGADRSSHTVTAAISGLLPGRTYHFRTVAANGIGATRGPDQTFTTAAAPPPPPPPPPPSRCRKGFVKKHGRCVRRHRHRRHRAHSRPGRG